MDDSNAIANLKRGNLIGLETLVRRYQYKALQTALMIVREQPLAQDVVQQSFLKVHDNIHHFRDGYPFAPWFFKIVINQAIDAVKHQSRLTSLVEEPEEDDTAAQPWITDPQPSPEEQMEEVENAEKLREALMQLKPEHRAALVMRYYLGYDDKTSAHEADKPVSTIKWWLRAAKKNLKALLQDQGLFRKVNIK